MVVANIRVAVQDPLVADRLRLARDEGVRTEDEPFFLDGPIAARVAIIDRDPATGRLAKPVPWSATKKRYEVPKVLTAPEAMAVSVFGIALETMAVFERQDVLGRKIDWQFDTPQLLIVPRAGEWPNAFYDRHSRSVQFFSFAGSSGERIHTALSRDIVAHEMGHAILDGLAPALYDALNPESRALHEAVADFTAIVMALESRSIRHWLVHERGGHLKDSNVVSQLARQFGEVVLEDNRPLRDVNNSLTMDGVGRHADEHRLCGVLTGAVWKSMVYLHRYALAEAQGKAGASKAVQAKALGISARRIARILFRGLDYLPPAEATFADYARALLRADEVVYPEDESGYRRTLEDEFLERGICTNRAQLTEERRPKEKWVDIDLDAVVASDWAAHEFARGHPGLLGMKRATPFRLLPRRDIFRRYYLGPGRHEPRREVVFQVTWEEWEQNVGISRVPAGRWVFRGTTLVIGGQPDGRGRYPILSCLTTDDESRHEGARNEALRRLVDRDQLQTGDVVASSRLRPLAPIAFGHVAGDALRVRGTARLLHLGRVDK